MAAAAATAKKAVCLKVNVNIYNWEAENHELLPLPYVADRILIRANEEIKFVKYEIIYEIAKSLRVCAKDFAI